MSEHCGYIIKVSDLRPHPNADKLQLLHIFETDTCVGLDVKVGDIGLYVPSDIRLGERFCQVNGLLRQVDENGNPIGNGYLDPEKRNVKAIKLRGQRSDGIYLPITSLIEFCTISDLKIGDKITVLNGEVICEKYIPKITNKPVYTKKDIKTVKKNIAPSFQEHVDTEQLAYNLDKFHAGDIIQLTCKLHGTSTRIGNLPALVTDKLKWWEKLLHRAPKTHYEYTLLTGTRRVILTKDRTGGYYESDEFRYAMTKKLEGKLPRGFTVYGEIVGYQGPNGMPIMPQCSNEKLKDKNFIKQYGSLTTFSYGCERENGYNDEHPCCQLYVYRITITNGHDEYIELNPAQIKYYCDLWGVNYVPEFETFIIPEDVNPGEYVARKVEQYYDGPDVIDPRHVREGVVIRILNRKKFEVYKHKNYSFKILEGLIKEAAVAPDIEEAQDVIESL